MTILEAAMQVLRERGEAMSAKEIHEAIVAQGLYQFRAKSPRSVLSGTIRSHLKSSATPGIVEVAKGSFRAA